MRRTLAVSLFALVCSTGVYAQAVVGSGALTGLVRDMYGDGIPDTTITLTNKVVGVKRTMMTSDNGIFDAPGLVPASSYSLKVTRRGYADWELPSFDLSVGETLNFKITLYADKAATPAEAVGALSAVQDSKTSVATLVTDDQLYGLPTKGRLLDALVLLAPAVTESNQGVLVFRGEAFTNSFLFDGVDTTNRYFLNRAGIAPFVSQDSASQMQVISAAAPAEFGHSMSGIVNMVTKTGTNSLHATAYDYFSQNSWNAPDPFGRGFKPTGKQNHAGLSVGLPVATDAFFLFGNIERVNNSSQGLNRITNPLLSDANGNIVSTGCTATAVQCNSAVAFLNAQNNLKVPMSQIATNGFVRMDFRPGERESFTVAAAIQSNREPNSMNNATVAPNGGLIGSNATYKDSTRYGTVGWTHVVSGIAVNEFHAFWFRNTLDATTDPTLYPSTTNAALYPGTGPIAITVAGTPVGGNPAYPFNLREQRYGGTDSFTLTEASHTIKLGADIGRNNDTMDQLYARYGQFNYASLSAFAADLTANVRQLKNYSTFVQTLGNPVTDLVSTGFHVYAQDTWKVFPRLVVTAGIRWEKERLPKPTLPNPATYQSGFIPSPNTDISPRIGFAFMIDKRTVFRAGGGTYYQPFPGQLIRDLFTGGGIYQSYYRLNPTVTGAPAFPKVLATTTAVATNLAGEFYTASRFRNPYTEQGSVALERRLNRWVSLAASYMLSQGVKIWTATDQNLPGGNTVSSTYTINNAQNAAVSTYTTPVWTTLVGPKYQVDTEASSRYRGATAQLRTAPIFGLTVQASYTWSHATDDLSGPPVYSIVSSNYSPGDYNGDRGPSAFDQRNRGVINWNWQPVFSKGGDILSRFLVNGWQISGIGTYSSSMYATPVVDVIGQQYTTFTMGYTTSLNGTGGWNRVPFQQINSLPIGAHTNLDVRVSRALPFTERLKGQLIFEAFNATNHQNVTAVNTIAYTATSGVLRPVTGLGAPIASYGYPYGSGARRLQVAFRLEF